MRQIEAAELMVAMSKYTVSYARSLLAATPESQHIDPEKPKALKGASQQQLDLMERESANLERELRLARATEARGPQEMLRGEADEMRRGWLRARAEPTPGLDYSLRPMRDNSHATVTKRWM